MLWFNDAIIEVLRQGVPIVTAITATAWGTSRTTTPKVRHVAMYSAVGWLAGYAASSLTLKVLEGAQQALPTPSEMKMLPESVSNDTSMSGLPYDPPIGNQVGEVVAFPAPVQEMSSSPSLTANGEHISVQGTMDNGSMGSAYGG